MKEVVKRCVDELGRVVLPKGMREKYGINTADELEIIATEEGIFLKKTECEEKIENQSCHG